MRRWMWWQDVLDLFYPHICLSCGYGRPLPEEPICLGCMATLPLTNFHRQVENPFTELFWGRVPIQTGAALFYFRKSGKVQSMVHALKYQHKGEVGQFLGKFFGRFLEEEGPYRSIDAIIPVPLHPRKLRQRGYNQSTKFGEGLAETLRKPLLQKVLIRTQNTGSQTRLGRWHRVENVASAFDLRQEELIRDKHILLVDDILTTGATLEACAQQLLNVPGVRVSMATIGFAR